MIHHIVLFTFNDKATPQKIEELASALEKMKSQIPGITRYVWGPSVSNEHLEKGYTHGFIMTFENEQCRDAYVPHPLHKALVANYVDPICDKGIAFDIKE